MYKWSFFCKNGGFRPKIIPSSQVNDGICDCCDASDEYNTKICQDICNERGATDNADFNKLLEIYDEAIEIRKSHSDSADDQLLKIEQEYQEKSAELNILEDELQVLKDLKDQYKKEEEEEDARLKKEWELKYLNKIENDHKDDEKLTEIDKEILQELLDDNKPQDEEKFPYPKEYAAPDDKKKEEEEKFPYPKEYAAPDNTKKQNPKDPVEEDPKEEEDVVAQEKNIPEYVPYKSDKFADINQKWLNKKRDKDKLSRKVSELESSLNHDYGTDKEFAYMIGQCYQLKVKQYTYEVCPFKDATKRIWW